MGCDSISLLVKKVFSEDTFHITVPGLFILKNYLLLPAAILAALCSSVSAQQSGSDQLSSVLDAEVFFNSERTLELELLFPEGAVPDDGVMLQLLVDPNRSSSGQHCLGTGLTYSKALTDFATHCETEMRDCDAYDGVWYCADQELVEKPALKIDSIVTASGTAQSATDSVPDVGTDTAAVLTPTSSESVNASASSTPDIRDGNDAVGATDANTCLATARDLNNAYSNFAQQCGRAAVDCDFHSNVWVCAAVAVESLSQSLIADAVASSGVQSAPAVASSSSNASVTLPAPVTDTSSENTDAGLNTNSNGNSNGRIAADDLLVLHFDNAPDRDDGHALVAGRVLSDTFGLNSVLAVNGTHGYARRGNFQVESESLFQRAWPSGLNAFRDWEGSVATSAALWSNTIAQGNQVWVAEGGPSDFTADVLRAMPAAQRKSVTVVQHSHGWNEDNTRPDNVRYVSNQAVYIRIDNGNLADNSTADLNRKSDFFVNTALSSQWGGLWRSAFNYLSPDDKLDFSDTVEVLWLLEIPLNQVANPVDFANRYLR